MRDMTYRKFDWSSLVDSQLLDGERVRLGKVVEIVDTADSSKVYLKVKQTRPNRRTLLFDTEAVGIVGDGWAMLDEPLRSSRAFIHADDDLEDEEDPEEPDQTADDEDLIEVDTPLEPDLPDLNACPYCGSESHAS